MVLSSAHNRMSKNAIQRRELGTSPWPVPLCAVKVSSLLGSGGWEMSLNACSCDAFHEMRALGALYVYADYVLCNFGRYAKAYE